MNTIPVMLLICCLILITSSEPVSDSMQRPSGSRDRFHPQHPQIVGELGFTVAKVGGQQHVINEGRKDPSTMPDAYTTRRLLRGGSSKFVTQIHPKGRLIPPPGPSCSIWNPCDGHA
ncbi:hypothetical protein O6H91_08G063100 [Diphasiastrum complanatum]|uniref:Uncharacterized protein n=2 Tax=Diphasiastrum complanatum TaxID=34168 RepID=A0ACC2CY41_DIPCM|nr:hypothetical protein O6H91_08G062900 [Diphasiastrum complanatum]KAJ7546977.1 hypothetical protein O6H91_08G063100 [Diphasiastrum complanatum]